MSTEPTRGPVRSWIDSHRDGAWGLALLAIGCLIYLPRLGSYPLWDPWEPHYAQVAWEMQERLTWFNPWYRGSDNWWSKPILMLWMLRASLGLFWDHVNDFANNELAARLPFALTAICGGILHYDWVRRLFGRTAGILAGLILMTAPQYLLIGRQVMADEPFLVAYLAAMGYLAVGFFTKREAPAVPAVDDPERLERQRTITFGVFWILLAFSVVAYGWAAAVTGLVVMVTYWAASFRWADYTGFLGERSHTSYAAVRGGIAAGIAVAAAGTVFFTSKLAPESSAAARTVLIDVAFFGIVFGVFHDFPLVRHAWRVLYRARAHIGLPIAVLLLLVASGINLAATGGEWRLAVRLSSSATGLVGDLLFNPFIWVPLPFLAFVRDRDGQRRLRAWLAVHWPLLAFWVLQAISVLAKGFIGPTLAVMILIGYWAATFRWRDYAHLTEKRRDWLQYVLIRGGIAVAIALVAFLIAYYVPGTRREQRQLYQGLIGIIALLTIVLAVFHDLPPMRHALRLLGRMHAGWGLIVFFAVGAPWFVYMSFEHGWPYWNEWIFYHHLGRAAGTIDKPGGTFDYFVRQVAFSGFPWTAFALGSLWMFLGRSSAVRSGANRRNLFVLLAAMLPYLFFTLSGTKFAHYIMPVLPLFVVMLAVSLAWLTREPDRIALAEPGPALGPELPVHDQESRPWYERAGARGDMLVFGAVALAVFGILAHDLVLDFRHLLRLFLYYYNRETPFDYQPFVILQVFFFPMGIVIGLLMFAHAIHRWHLVAFSTLAVIFACYLSWVTMPAMKDTYSFKPFYTAYQELAKPGEPIGQFNDWQQPVRSVIFLFQNRCVHLRTERQTTAFLKRPGRKFVMVDRNRLADLRRVAKEADVQLYVVFDDHPYGRMVSDQPSDTDTRKAAEHILSELPSDAQTIDANFEDKIRMVGWKVTPREPVNAEDGKVKTRAGTSVDVELYFEALTTMRRDWQIFIHGDGPRGGSNRIHADHFPLEGLYPTTEWQEGEIVRDQFTINIPSDYPFDYLYLWTGWYIGNQRLKLVNNPPNDGQNRVRGPRVDVARD